MQISYYASFALMWIALLASLTIYLQARTDLYLKLFPAFLLISATMQTAGDYMAMHGQNNVFLANLFTAFAFCYYYFSLREIIHNKTVKRIILYILRFYPVLVAINVIGVQKMTAFHTMTYSLGSLLIVALSVYYFLELFQLSPSVDLRREPAFWICSGLLFYFTCSFPVYGLANFIKEPSIIIIRTMAIISNLLDVFLYSSFTIAFLCRLRIRKSMS